MANASVARGLIPYRDRSGAPYNGAANIYYVPAANATALYVGDPVQMLSASADGNGIPAVRIITAGNGTDTPIATYGIIGSVVGRVVGGEPVIPITRDSTVYIPALTAAYILVADDPFLLFEVQENGNMAGATPTAGSVPGPGKNVDLVSGTGSTTTGYSGWTLGSASLSVNALQMRVIRMLEQADNVLGTNAKWLTSINLHQLTNTAGE